jgi:hypothetical protein
VKQKRGRGKHLKNSLYKYSVSSRHFSKGAAPFCPVTRGCLAFTSHKKKKKKEVLFKKNNLLVIYDTSSIREPPKVS